MARISVDDMFARDPRMYRLAELCGWSRRETRSCLQDVWALCYDRVVPYLPARDIEGAALADAIAPPAYEQGFAAALLEVGLARAATAKDRFFTKKDKERTRIPWRDQQWKGRIYLAGAADRVAYLLAKSESGYQGGVASGESRRRKREEQQDKSAKHRFNEREAPRNPPDLVPDSSPDPVPDGAGVPDPRELAELAERLEPLPDQLTLAPSWSPRETADNQAAIASAERRGVFVPYATRKFVERAIRAGWSLVDIEPRWREMLLTEFPTKPEIRAAFNREQREAIERAARDRERVADDERKQRAETDLPDVRRAAKAALDSDFRPPTEKATA